MELEREIERYIPVHPRCRHEESKRKWLRMVEKNEILGNVNTLTADITISWVKQDPDMSSCRVCKEVIYGSIYKMEVVVEGEKVVQKRQPVLCEPCYYGLTKTK